MARDNEDSDLAVVMTARLNMVLAQRQRVIWALMLREMRSRFGHSRLGYAWALGEPVFFIVVLSALKTMTGLHAPPLGYSMEVFIFTGVVPFLLFRRLAAALTGAISANRALLKYPPVRPLDTLIARTLLEVATLVVSSTIVAIAFLMMGLPIIPPDPLGFIAGLGIAALLGAGYGAVGAAIHSVFAMWATLSGWVLRALFLTSGIFFVIDFLPPNARVWLAWNPLAEAIALGRESYYTGFNSEILSLPYMLTCGFGLLTLGLLGIRALQPGGEE